METVTQPISDQDLKIQENIRIFQATLVERSWWPDDKKIIPVEEAKKALQKGDLIQVPKEGADYRLIYVLSGLESGKEPDVLRPQTYEFMLYFMTLWRKKIGVLGQDIKLAVTSLYRDEDLQRKLIENNECNGHIVKSTESSHLAGAAIDISCRSYYQVTPEGLRGVQSWNSQSGIYKPEIGLCLGEILTDLDRQGKCNFVIENSIKDGALQPSVFHVCVSPFFSL